MTITTYVVPPGVIEVYSSILLTYPKIGDSCEVLCGVMDYIYGLRHKICGDGVKLEKFNEMYKTWLRIYEWAQAKEEELKGKTGNKTQMPFYYIECADKCHRGIFARLRRESVR